MLAKAMIEKLNEQINLEFYSSNLYLQMSAWCEDKGFEGRPTSCASTPSRSVSTWSACSPT